MRHEKDQDQAIEVAAFRSLNAARAANPQSAGRHASEPFCCFCRESAANGHTNPRTASPSHRKSSKRTAAKRCRGRCVVAPIAHQSDADGSVCSRSIFSRCAAADVSIRCNPSCSKRCSASAARSCKPEFVSVFQICLHRGRMAMRTNHEYRTAAIAYKGWRGVASFVAIYAKNLRSVFIPNTIVGARRDQPAVTARALLSRDPTGVENGRQLDRGEAISSPGGTWGVPKRGVGCSTRPSAPPSAKAIKAFAQSP